MTDRPAIDSVEGDLPRGNAHSKERSLKAMPKRAARVGRLRAEHGGRDILPTTRWENVRDWGLTILCGVTFLAGAIVGNAAFGAVGLWAGELFGLVLFGSFAWRWAGRRKRR